MTLTIEQARQQAADWLENTHAAITKLVNMPGHGWDYERTVTKWSESHACGTICCWHGWMPQVYPDILIYDRYRRPVFRKDKRVFYRPVFREDETVFYPHRIGVPISRYLYHAIVFPGEQYEINEPKLQSDCTFYEFTKFLNKVISRIRKGELDDFLLTEINSYE